MMLRFDGIYCFALPPRRLPPLLLIFAMPPDGLIVTPVTILRLIHLRRQRLLRRYVTLFMLLPLLFEHER